MAHSCLSQRSSRSLKVLFSILLLALTVSPLPAWAQEPNLLQNPSFEEPYGIIPGKENCRIAIPWVAYYYEGSPEQTRNGYLLAPEYKPAFRSDYPGNRVRSGDRAQQWFHSYGNFEGGIYQQVPNIHPGTRVRFEIWAMSWSCDRESKGNCDKATSGDPSPMHLRIGIDPTGGTDARSAAIVWSPENNAYDAWTLLQVEAVAQRPAVTVFVYAYPTYRSQDNNVYVDDASLVVLAPPPTATPRPTVAPAATATLQPTEPPAPTNTPEPPTSEPPTVEPPTATPMPTDTAAPTSPPTATELPAPTEAPTLAPTAAPTAAPAPASASLAGNPWLSTGLGIILGLIVIYAIGRRYIGRA